MYYGLTFSSNHHTLRHIYYVARDIYNWLILADVCCTFPVRYQISSFDFHIIIQLTVVSFQGHGVRQRASPVISMSGLVYHFFRVLGLHLQSICNFHSNDCFASST
jgi:hypothetical protein